VDAVSIAHLTTCDPITHPVNVMGTVNTIESELWKIRRTVGIGT
jgi:hypothetical protein